MATPSITVENQILVFTTGLFFLPGLLINVFIVAVNMSEWKKGRPVSTTDKVITSLGISMMVFQVTGSLNVILDVYFKRLNFMTFMSVKFLEITSVYSSIWLSTLLSVVFCLKISTLHNAFFLRLKSLVLKSIFHLIMASIVMSASYCCLMITLRSHHNSTQETYSNFFMGISKLIFLKTGPFLINFMSSGMLITYLYFHMSRMRSRRNGTSQLDPYYKTIKFTAFSLFCSTVYFITGQTRYWYNVFNFLVLYIVWQIFSTLHCIYLFYVTANLRIQVSNMIRFLSGDKLLAVGNGI